MRQFKLWNAKQTEAFDFAIQGCLITEVSGLGLSFTTTLNNRAVVEHEREFDEIALLTNFGINANAYTAFNQFAAFVAANGRNKMVLEYTVNDRTVYADVWLKRMPKSQKTAYNILSETLLFTRVSYWYQIVSGTIPAAPAYQEIIHTFFEDLLVDLTIRASTPDDFRVITKNPAGDTLSQIIIPTQIVGGTLTLNAEEKYVDRYTALVHSNGYNLVSREGDTFLVLTQGTYRISTNVAVTNQPLFTYKKWVID